MKLISKPLFYVQPNNYQITLKLRYNIHLPEGEPFFKKERKKTCPRMLGTLTCLTKTDGQVSSLTCQEQEKKAGTICLQVQNS